MAIALRAPSRALSRTLLQMLGGMAFGAVFGVCAAILVLADPPSLQVSDPAKLLVALFTLASFPLLVGLHELGHLLSGIAVGFRPLLFVVGPLRVERVGDALRARWGLRGAMVGGLAVSVPTDTRDLRRRTFWMIAGGPLASLGAGALCLALRPFASAVPVADLLLLIAGVVSLLLGMTALAPTRTGGFFSDGLRMLRLARGGGDVEREVAVLALLANSMSGRRPREWDAELVARAAAGDPDTVFGVAGRQYASAFERDHGRMEAARAHLDAAVAAVDVLPRQTRSSLMLAAAYFAARFDRDPARARAFLDQAEGELITQGGDRPLAEAALAWAEGDHPRAAEHLAAAEKSLEGSVDAGGLVVAREEIASLRGMLG